MNLIFAILLSSSAQAYGVATAPFCNMNDYRVVR